MYCHSDVYSIYILYTKGIIQCIYTHITILQCTYVFLKTIVSTFLHIIKEYRILLFQQENSNLLLQLINASRYISFYFSNI